MTVAATDADAVTLREVGLRDGLQLVDAFFPTDQKRAWISAEAACGVSVIEVTSLVPPKIGPQFVDAAEVVAHALTIPGLQVMALVPNLKGAERAVALGVHALNFVMSASRTHNLKNVRREREESLADLEAIARMVRALPAAQRPRIAAGLSTALGCSYEGRITPAEVARWAARFAELGVDEIVIADTVGYGDPRQVRETFGAVQRAVGGVPLVAHLHDTRGTGLANAAAAYDCGVRRFDASLGGLGGCPFAPGASGNLVFEDLCFMFDSMGIATGIDLPRLLAVREIVARNLPQVPLVGALARAGLPRHYTSINFTAPA
jgi:hydroxymethylglutaryl-CoA lyase